MKSALFLFFVFLLVALSGSVQAAVSNTDCAVCTIVIGVSSQLIEIRNQSVDSFIERDLCALFPANLKGVCDYSVVMYGPIVIEMLENKETADVICQEIKFCSNLSCNLFPSPKDAQIPQKPRSYSYTEKKALPNPIDWLKDLINHIFNIHEPAVDMDDDNFSTIPTLRGTNWRGRDCNDVDNTVYPGRNFTTQPPTVDHNCNGIYGIDPTTGKSYEEELCAGTDSRGFAILGDSAAAHFSIPPEYVTASSINNRTFSGLMDILATEFDWPQLSGATAFENSSYYPYSPNAPGGLPVRSVAKELFERNRCNHRDFQSIAVNGARAGAMVDIVKSFARNQKLDKPVSLILALIGNDVCNGHPGLGSMTTPSEFYDSIVKVLQYLDTVLPPDSHVVLVGLVDGRVLFDNMAYRIHPIGQLHQDVNYVDVYNYLACLGITPCWGWMNPSAYWRNLTSERAANLSAAMSTIPKTQKFENFDMFYMDYPLQTAIEIWQKMGGQTWQLIEPVDGFHPSTAAQSLIADVLVSTLQKKFPQFLGSVNPNNEKIKNLFGNQGGYN